MFQSDGAVGGASQCTSIFTESSLWLASSGMDFQAVAFIPLPPRSDLCLKEFSPLASFLFAGMAEPWLWMHSNGFDLKFRHRVLCWEAFLLQRAKGNNWTFFILNHTIWHANLICVLRCPSPKWVGCKAIAFLDRNQDLTFDSSPKQCQVGLALCKGNIRTEENAEA